MDNINLFPNTERWKEAEKRLPFIESSMNIEPSSTASELLRQVMLLAYLAGKGDGVEASTNIVKKAFNL